MGLDIGDIVLLVAPEEYPQISWGYFYIKDKTDGEIPKFLLEPKSNRKKKKISKIVKDLWINSENLTLIKAKD
jgi:hypothetical protein